MLATGGMMAIAMIGTAMSGLMSAGASTSAQEEEDAGGPLADDGAPDGAEASAVGALSSMLFEPVHAIEGHALETGPDMAGDPDQNTASSGGALNADGDYALKGGSLTVALSEASPDLDASLGANLGAGTAFDVTEYTELSGGSKVHVVGAFRSGIDRLILDFDGPQEDAPRISLDIQTSPGDTLIRANGIPVTLLKDLVRAEPEDVEVHMSESYTRIADLADDGFGPQPSAADNDLFAWTGDHRAPISDLGAPSPVGGSSDAAATVASWIADAATDAETATLASAPETGPAEGPDGSDGSAAPHGQRDLHGKDPGDAGSDPQMVLPDMSDRPDMDLPGDVYDSVETVEVAEHIGGFNPALDVIEIVFDPDLTPDPEVTVEDFLDGTGANILFDGQVVLSVTGGQGLDPAMVELREIEAASLPQPA